MSLSRPGLVLAIAAGVFSIGGDRPTREVGARTGNIPPQQLYSPQSVERYLSTEDISYIRPGYHIKVNSVTIPADLRPVADCQLHRRLRPAARPARQGDAGTLSASLILAWYDPATRNYTSYTTRIATSAPPSKTPGVQAVQAAADSGGAAVHGFGARPCDLQVQDGASRQLRQDQDDDARDLRHPKPDGHHREELLRQRRVRLSSRRPDGDGPVGHGAQLRLQHLP